MYTLAERRARRKETEKMYKVILVSGSERVLYSGNDGYVALSISKRERAKTKFAVVLQTRSGKRYSVAKQEEIVRRLKIAV